MNLIIITSYIFTNITLSRETNVFCDIVAVWYRSWNYLVHFLYLMWAWYWSHYAARLQIILIGILPIITWKLVILNNTSLYDPRTFVIHWQWMILFFQFLQVWPMVIVWLMVIICYLVEIVVQRNGVVLNWTFWLRVKCFRKWRRWSWQLLKRFLIELAVHLFGYFHILLSESSI